MGKPAALPRLLTRIAISLVGLFLLAVAASCSSPAASNAPAATTASAPMSNAGQVAGSANVTTSRSPVTGTIESMITASPVSADARGTFSNDIFNVTRTALVMTATEYALHSPTPPPTPTLTAVVLTVTKLDDTFNRKCDPQDCSLTDAIYAAPWGATILFAPGLHGTITLNKQGSIIIDKYLTIDGPGPRSDGITIANSGTIQISPWNPPYFPTVYLNNLTFDDTGLNINGAAVFINNCTFKNNRNSAIRSYNGSVTVTNSTFEHNNNPGTVDNLSGSLLIANSTFYQTGFAVHNTGKATIINSTFVDNEVAVGTESQYYAQKNHTTLTLKNSLIVTDTTYKIACRSPIIDGGSNLQFPVSDCGASIPTVDPKVAEFGDHGGPTDTISLDVGSPAIGAGNLAICQASPVNNLDERGYLRTGSGHAACDIGAFQHDGLAPVETNSVQTTTPIETLTPTSTLTGTSNP